MVTFSPRITFGSPLILDQGCSGPFGADDALRSQSSKGEAESLYLGS